MAVKTIKEVPKSDYFKLACRRCGGWGRYVYANGGRITCDRCGGSGEEPKSGG